MVHLVSQVSITTVNHSNHHGNRLLIIIFAIFVCVCVGCCRRCYCKSGRSNYSSREITTESDTRPIEYIEQLSSNSSYNKGHVDAPPSYFDVNPNFMQDDDLPPPPYPGDNNTWQFIVAICVCVSVCDCYCLFSILSAVLLLVTGTGWGAVVASCITTQWCYSTC